MDINYLLKQNLPSDSEIKRVEIFVLHYQDRDLLQRCLSSIALHTTWPYKLTVLSTDMYPKGLLAKIYNKLIKESTCDYIAFVCSDAEVGVNWLYEIMRSYQDNYGCVVPLTLPPVNKDMDHDYRSGIVPLSPDAISIAVSVFKKNNLIDVGCFDENFYLYGHDVDLLRKLYNAGHKLVVNTNSIVTHKRGSTTKKVFSEEEMLAINEYTKQLLKQ